MPAADGKHRSRTGSEPPRVREMCNTGAWSNSGHHCASSVVKAQASPRGGIEPQSPARYLPPHRQAHMNLGMLLCWVFQVPSRYLVFMPVLFLKSKDQGVRSVLCGCPVTQVLRKMKGLMHWLRSLC